MEQPRNSPDRAARGDAPRPPRLVVSFVDRNWLWSRAGLALSLFLAVVIAGFTLTPLPPGPAMPAGMDKIYHFLAFAVLVFPVIVTDTGRWTWVVPVAIAYGGAIELLQPFVGRNAEWLDFGANVSGVLAGAALSEILHNRIRRSVLGPEPDLRTDLPRLSEAERMEIMRAELMDELRAVLREELSAASLKDDHAARHASGGASHGASDTPPSDTGPDAERSAHAPDGAAPLPASGAAEPADPSPPAPRSGLEHRANRPRRSAVRY
ncbi:MAG: VanZ family protein [Pararhodobacter sp.]